MANNSIEAGVSMQAQIEQEVENWRRQRPDLDFDWLRLVLQIRRIERILRDNQAGILPEVGGGHGELEVVGHLRSVGPPYALRPTDLFLALSLTSGTMTGRIDRLIALGWVERERCSADGRAWQIRLTEKGLSVSDRLVEHGANGSVLSRALANVSKADRATLTDSLARLMKLLDHEMSRSGT